jgi:hypothetical protein
MESLNYRCQRVPCHTICPNENILLPRLRHTRVQKIQKLIEGETLEASMRRFHGRQMPIA